MHDNKKQHKLITKSCFQEAGMTGNFPDLQHKETMNQFDIKKKKKHTAFIQPHAYDKSYENKTNDDENTIDIFCNLKYQENAYNNTTKNNLGWFANPQKTCNNEHVFGVCLTERDRQHLIKAFPKTSLNTASIQVPNVIKTDITKQYVKNKKESENNNIMWLGIWKAATAPDSLKEALRLAKMLHDSKTKQKVIIIISGNDNHIRYLYDFIHKCFPDFNCNPDSFKTDTKTAARKLGEAFRQYMRNGETKNTEYNIDFFLDQNPEEIDEIAKQCSYLYKPDQRGFSETASAFANSVAKGLIVITDRGYMTEKDYYGNGRFRNAVILGSKYKKGAKLYDKIQTRINAEEAYKKIMELENNPAKKQQKIDAVFDLYERKFNQKVVKKLWELHLDSIDGEKFNNQDTTVLNSLDNNNRIVRHITDEREEREVAYIRNKNKYKQNGRQNFVVREKMIQVKNICLQLMAELDLSIEDVCTVFGLASSHHGFTNSEGAMMALEALQADEEKKEKMKEFSKLFQYYADQNDILSPKSADPNKKQVGLRTKRVLDLFDGEVQNFKNFLTHNTTQLQLS